MNNNLSLLDARSSTGAECYAVRVTPDNILEVAEWCDGEVVETNYPNKPGFSNLSPYKGIKLDAIGYDWARMGDFVVKYKHASHWAYVYSPMTFQAMFTEM